MSTNNNNNNNNNANATDNGGSPAPARSFGITQPISMKLPDASDFVQTKHLEDTLRSYDYFESSEELSHRVQVMAKLNVLVREWIRSVSLAKNVPAELADSVGGRVHTFGSYRLGVHSKGKGGHAMSNECLFSSRRGHRHAADRATTHRSHGFLHFVRGIPSSSAGSS